MAPHPDLVDIVIVWYIPDWFLLLVIFLFWSGVNDELFRFFYFIGLRNACGSLGDGNSYDG